MPAEKERKEVYKKRTKRNNEAENMNMASLLQPSATPRPGKRPLASGMSTGKRVPTPEDMWKMVRQRKGKDANEILDTYKQTQEDELMAKEEQLQR